MIGRVIAEGLDLALRFSSAGWNAEKRAEGPLAQD